MITKIYPAKTLVVSSFCSLATLQHELKKDPNSLAPDNETATVVPINPNNNDYVYGPTMGIQSTNTNSSSTY